MDNTALILGVIGTILSALTIFAIYYGPIKALKIQRTLDSEREDKNRKLSIFKTLMSYRVTRLAHPFAQALNLIDIEFTGNNLQEKAVREAWKELNDLYANYNTTINAEDKANELVAALLAAMGKCLGYDFDKVYLKKGGYYPAFLFNVEMEQHTLRRQLLEVLDGTGRRKIPVAIFEQKFPDVGLPAKSDIPENK